MRKLCVDVASLATCYYDNILVERLRNAMLAVLYSIQ